jgi:phage-related minor tail protein
MTRSWPRTGWSWPARAGAGSAPERGRLAFTGVEADAEQAAAAVSDSLGEGGEQGAKKMSSAVDAEGGGFVDKVKGVAALAAAAFGAAFVIDSYLQADTAVANLQASLGATPEFARQMGKVAGDLYANNFGESVGDAAAAVRATLQAGLLPEDATNAQIESVTGNLINLAGVMELDVGETARAAGRLVQTGLAGTAAEAVDVLTRGVQQGANAAGDLADVMGEYGTTFAQLGLDGATSVGLMNQALAAGIPNADFAADALREMGIIGREGGDSAAAALKSLGINAKDYFTAMDKGGPAAAKAMDTVLDALRNTEDPSKRSAAAVQLVGTQYEDLGDALLQMDPSEATASLGEIKGAAQDMSDTLGDTAAGKIETLKRGLQSLATDALGGLIAGFTDGKSSGEGLAGAMSSLGATVRDVTDWLGEHTGVLTGIGVVVGTVLLPILAAWGIAAVVNAAKNVVAWLSVAFTASGSAAAQEASAAQVGLSWLTMGARAVLNAARIAVVWIAQTAWATATLVAGWAWTAARTLASWTVMAAQAVIRGVAITAVWVAQTAWATATTVAGWAWAALTTLASWALMAAQAVVRGAVIAAVWIAQTAVTVGPMILAWGIAVATIVGGWVLMGVQSLIQAARMAAAWLIAMGPVGWIILAVIGLVALIIANWDRVKAFTVAAFNAIVGAVVGAFHWIVDGVSSGVAAVISFVSGLPGRILSALGNLGSLLVGVGGDLMRGLVNGIAAAASFVGNVARNVVNAIIRFINDRLINGINNLLEFTIAGVHINPPDIPRIPLLAAGAVVTRPTLAIVGEAGPEVVLPLSGARAGRRGQLMEQAGIGGAGTTIDARQYYEVRDTQTAEEVGAIVGQRVVHDVRNGITGAYAGAVA